jgi:hypothetical protein
MSKANHFVARLEDIDMKFDAIGHPRLRAMSAFAVATHDYVITGQSTFSTTGMSHIQHLTITTGMKLVS